MKVKLSRTASLILSVSLFVGATALALCLAYCRFDGGEGRETDSEQETAARQDGHVTTDSFVYKSEISDAVKTALNTTDAAYLILANKVNVVAEDHVPADLVDVDTGYTLYGKDLQLAGHAATAAIALIDELRASGYGNVYITSGYRSYTYQQTLFDRYYDQEKAKDPTLSDEELRERVLAYSAAPGTSEHQTGLCMDLFVSPGMRELENYGHEGNDPDDIGFAETEEYQWLMENAHKFGFILRYPDNKTAITGYNYESWHYRFVGVDAATEIYENGITLEEYLGK